MKRLLKEPLLHFLVLGAVLFVAYGILFKGSETEPGKIVVTQGQIASIVTMFARTWQRPPTDAELQGLRIRLEERRKSPDKASEETSHRRCVRASAVVVGRAAAARRHNCL
jgi:hypothetical protein